MCQIWYPIYGWIGYNFISHNSHIINFVWFKHIFKKKRSKTRKYIIWCTIILYIWSHQNKIFFMGDHTIDFEGLLAQIKLTYWFMLTNLKIIYFSIFGLVCWTFEMYIFHLCNLNILYKSWKIPRHNLNTFWLLKNNNWVVQLKRLYTQWWFFCEKRNTNI